MAFVLIKFKDRERFEKYVSDVTLSLEPGFIVLTDGQATQTVFPAADIAHVIVRTTGRVLARCPECERMNFAENGRMLGHLRVDDSLLPRACLGTGKEPSTSIPRESA